MRWKFEDLSLKNEIPEDMDLHVVPDYVSTGRVQGISKEKVQGMINY